MTTISRLEQMVGPNRLLTQPEDLIPYSFDATPVLNQLPLAVVFTEAVEEVIAVLKLANEIKTPIVTRGSGTGLSAGAFQFRAALSCVRCRWTKSLGLICRISRCWSNLAF
jgi:glycolate oxidase